MESNKSESSRAEIFAAIDAERGLQDIEWGGATHDDDHTRNDWIAFLTKHLGRAVNGRSDQFDKQMVRVAALAVAAVEWSKRGGQR